MLLLARSRLLWMGLIALAFATIGFFYLGGSFNGALLRDGERVASAGSSAGVDWKIAARGFRQVTDIQFVPGSRQSAVILVKDGTARYVSLEDGHAVTADQSPVLLSVAVRTESELGLLGLVFHPNYLKNGLFYLNYTPAEGKRRTRVSEWRLERKRLGHERASELRVLLEVEQPFNNHNAGQLAFGPDGMLYIGLGDGGKGADPYGNGQNLSTLLGSMLRIDVDRKRDGKQYAIPKGNPFANRKSARPEIWAYGLRNPWRFSFDPSGRLVVGDVGQDSFEEIDIVERGDNLGWAVREARHCFPPGAKCRARGFKDPVFEYGRGLGQSVTGGYVYLGRQLPKLHGKYVFADYQSGAVWALELPSAANGKARATQLGKWRRLITTFGRDSSGELYAGDFGSGDILELVASGAS